MKSILVPKNEQNRRLDSCKKCDHYKLGFCKKCGCYMPLKTKLSKATCPIDKWINPAISWTIIEEK